MLVRRGKRRGANPLYLAIGLLRWYEKKNSPRARYAPLLLLPVDLVYKRGRYYIRKRDEEISLNITLIEYIRQTYGIRIKGIDPLPRDEHGVDVSLIFAQSETLSESRASGMSRRSVSLGHSPSIST